MPKVKNPRIPRKNSIVWKLVRNDADAYTFVLVKLKVLGRIIRPSAASHSLRNGRYGTKYRTDNAQVLGIYERKIRRKQAFFNNWHSSYCHEYRRGKELNVVGQSFHDSKFKYNTGKIVKSVLDTNLDEDCGAGIHFFRTQSEALHYWN